MDIKGKVALITGGARMGEAIALALARKGGELALSYRSSADSTRRIADQVQALKVKNEIFQADVSSPEACRDLVAGVVEKLGRLDILVHLASLYKKTTPFSSESLKERRLSRPLAEPFAKGREEGEGDMWQKYMDIHMRSAFELARAAAGPMKEGGRIIFFSDWVAASGRPRYKDFVPYYVSKVGVKGLTESLALELAPNILVNAIAPGPILPPPDLSKAAEEEVKKATPLARWGGPEEIAKAVVFLIETDFVTGECLRVDGGRHLY